MAASEEILNRIRKLLRLSESPNDHEARSALAKAQSLLLEHGLTRAQVAEEPQWSSEVIATYRSGYPMELKLAQSIAQEFFFVRTLQRRMPLGPSTLELFGEPHHVAVATHVVTFLQRTFRDLWNRHRVEQGIDARPPARVRNGYLIGVFNGLRETLVAERLAAAAADHARRAESSDGKPSVALAVVQAEAALEEAFSQLQHRKARKLTCTIDDDHINQGLRDGRAIRLQNSIAESRVHSPNGVRLITSNDPSRQLPPPLDREG